MVVHKVPRKEYRPREQGQSLSASFYIVEAPESDSCDTITLKDWDDWLCLGTSTLPVVEPGSGADSDN